MDMITKSYEEGKYLQCLSKLTKLPSGSLIDELIVQNNVTVTKFQLSYVQNDGSVDEVTFSDFLGLWSKILTLPHKEEFNLVTICCASNVIYSVLNGMCSEVSTVKAAQIGCEALEKILSNHQVFFLVHKQNLADKFIYLMNQLLLSKKLKLVEESLLLYITVLTCFIQPEDHKYLELIVELLGNVECKLGKDAQPCSVYPIFLLFPLEIPVNSLESVSLCTVILDFSRVFLLLHYSVAHSWAEALAVKNATTSQLSDICTVLKMYSGFHSVNQKLDFSIEFERICQGKSSHLTFAIYLINAAKFAIQENPFMALKLLNCTIAEKVAQTQACSIVMTFAATQFKALQQTEFEIEALEIAEKSLTESPSLKCTFHAETIGFLLAHLDVFRLPELTVLKYQLARTFLQNKRYQKASVEYERLFTGTFNSKETTFTAAFKMFIPSNTVLFHERILALILANNCEKAIEIIDSSPEEDFLVSFLHAEAFVYLNKPKKAIQLMNRSTVELGSTMFNVDGTKDIIKAKFHLKLAKLLDQTGNTKDAYHQMRLAAEFGFIDRSFIDFAQKFCQKFAENIEYSLPPESDFKTTISQILGQSSDLALHYALLSSTK